jgi:hypothetical protein
MFPPVSKNPFPMTQIGGSGLPSHTTAWKALVGRVRLSHKNIWNFGYISITAQDFDSSGSQVAFLKKMALAVP